MAGKSFERPSEAGDFAPNKDSAPVQEQFKLSFVFTQDKLFASGSVFELSSNGIREVRKASSAIKRYMSSHSGEKFKIYVDGYTDSTGGKEVNKRYSLRRAAAVANELADSEIDYRIIEPRGLGADGFINRKNTSSHENRRVEIKVMIVR